jgi:hypothetical protein
MFKNPGALTISCIIGQREIDKALLDQRAGVKPTTVILQLADRSIKKPRGIVEYVISKVDKFFFLVDFIVLDIEPVSNPKKANSSHP